MIEVQQRSTATASPNTTSSDQQRHASCTNDRHRPACNSFTPRWSLELQGPTNVSPGSCRGRGGRCSRSRARTNSHALAGQVKIAHSLNRQETAIDVHSRSYRARDAKPPASLLSTPNHRRPPEHPRGKYNCYHYPDLHGWFLPPRKPSFY